MSIATSDVQDIVDLEVKLAARASSSEERRDKERLYNANTLAGLASNIKNVKCEMRVGAFDGD